MNGLILARPLTPAVPALIVAAGDRVGMRFLEFFAALRPHRCSVRHVCRDIYTQNRRLWVRLREKKGGKRHATRCHHNLEEYLTPYLDGAGLRGDPKGPLFRTIGRGTGQLTRTVLPQANAYAMIGQSRSIF